MKRFVIIFISLIVGYALYWCISDYYYKKGRERCIVGKYKLFFLLMIFLCISCGNNKISIRVESALISSSDNQPLRSLTLENDSLLFTYQISLKDGYVGLSSINLNRINDAYVITYGNSIIENEKFHLQPDATYIISNHSIPDAKSHALEFKTNPRGNVKSVKEVK